MKRLIVLLVGLFSINTSFSQTVQASLGIGSQVNRVNIYLKPTLTLPACVFSTLQFTVALPSTITPIPTLTVVNTAFAGAPASQWIVEAPYIENGYIVYPIYSAATGFTLPVTANTEFAAMEVAFSNGPLGTYADAANIICLPDGGLGGSGSAYFFCSGQLDSDGSNLFYARAGVTVMNGTSYKPGGISAIFTSYARLATGVVLPVSWLSFSAAKQGNNALLNWRVANEGKCDHYEVFRSTNGTDFTKFGTVSKSAAANGSYSFTDLGINSFSTSVVYYRVKQVDIDAASTYSEIKHIDIDKAGAGEVSIFPNPVKDGFYVNVPLTRETEKQKVTLNLYGTNGQIIASKVITAQQAANFYFDITDRKLASGQYNLQVVIQDKMIATKMLTINQ